MFALPLVIAQQLVADKRATFQADADAARLRSRKHRARRPLEHPSYGTPLPRRPPITIGGRHADAVGRTQEAAPVSKVA